MPPREQREMLAVGERLLVHYREEREERLSMLGDAPLPADEGKERKLQESMLRLRSYQRQGWLDSDRNAPSWVEWRRRRKQRRGRGEGSAQRPASGGAS